MMECMAYHFGAVIAAGAFGILCGFVCGIASERFG